MRILANLILCLIAGSLQARAVEVDYARNFLIDVHSTHTVLTVRNAYRNATQQHRYALVPKGDPIPQGLPEDATLIRTPVANVALMETVYVGFLDALGQIEAIRAASSARFMNHPTVIERLASGQITGLQSGQKVDVERLLLLQPDLILTTSLGTGSFELSPQLKRSKLPVVLTADYMERHPLGRAEWLKFIAAFFDAEAQAERVFKEVEAEYLNLTMITELAEERPSVFCGATYAGVWHVPGGRSFFAQILKDAGAEYLWHEDTSAGGLPLDLERVYLKAADADFWINPSHYRSLRDLFAADNRFAHFEAVTARRVFNQTRQVSATGGNPVWERGIIRPDEVLADLIHIFHPEKLPDHTLVYYEVLE